MNESSFFVCVEGIDGCGKTSLIKNLADRFYSQGWSVLITEEPTNSDTGLIIKEILDHRLAAPKQALDFQRLYLMDRKSHINDLLSKTVQIPDLITITGRYYMSTFAYGMAFGCTFEEIVKLHDEIIGSSLIVPDVTILLDLPPSIAIERIAQREGNRNSGQYFEKEKTLRLVRTNYRQLCRIDHPWFCNIHELDVSENGEKAKAKTLAQTYAII